MFSPDTRVLVVDDMLTMRRIIKKNLGELGLKDVLEAGDGNLAWQQLCAANPPVQLVISDWNMPNCSGLEFLRQVRADAKYAKLPFVMLTAEAESGQVKEALAAGVSNYVIKPFTPDILKAKLLQVYQRLAA